MSVAQVSSTHGVGYMDGLEPLMTLAFQGAHLGPLAARLIAEAEASGGDAGVLMDLSIVLQLHGLRELGIATQAHALTTQRRYRIRSASEPAFRLLAIAAPGDIMTNTPLEFLLAGSDIALEVLYLAPGEPMPVSLPAHDAVFVAVAHSETALPLLAALQGAAPSWATRVINLPGRIPRTARTKAFKILQSAPGVHIPQTVRVSRSELLAISGDAMTLGDFLAEATFPVIVRPVDSHAGQGLDRIDAPDQLPAYVRGESADEFFISPFIDYRSLDGLFRKYRVVLVDGTAYPGHMGISAHWMIHYLNAGMTESAAKRSEEERFMRDFRTGFGARHAAALDAIATRFGLDYLVIDCGETVVGELIVFEVCTGAVVHAMDPVDRFAYKRSHMDDAFSAFRSLVIGSRDARREAP